MPLDGVLLVTLQSAAVFFLIWITFRLIPSVPANAKAWIWRLALLKPLIGLLPLAVVSLRVLPAPSPDLVSPGSSANVVTLGQVAPPTFATPSSVSTPDPWLILWLVGILAVGGKGIQERCQARKIVRRAVPVTSPILQRFLDESTARVAKGRMVRPVRLLVSDDATTGMLVGGRRPAIVLPKSVLESSSLVDARLLIAHELGHLVRRDLEWLSLAWVVQSVFFFNPFVWLAVRASYEAHESATDGYAVELAEVPAHRYAEMLVRLLVTTRPLLVPGAVFMSGSYRSIHRRLEAMKHFRSPSNPWRKPAFGALALAVVCLMPAYRLAQASPPQEQPGQASNPKGPAGQLPRDQSWYWLPLLDPALPDNLCCTFNQYDVRSALTKVLRRHGKNFKIEPEVRGSVTLALLNVSLADGVMNIARQVGAGYKIEQGVYVIANRFAPPRPVVTLQHAPPVYKEIPISMEYEKIDAREILRLLFRNSARSYSIDPAVQGTVSISVKDATFEDALRKIVRQINCTFQLKDGVYIVLPAEKPPLR